MLRTTNPKTDRIMLIGQAPGPGARRSSIEFGLRESTRSHDRDALVPLPGTSGNAFRILVGMSIEEYDSVFDRLNVVDEFHGKNGKGDRFAPSQEQKERIRLLADGRRVIALGKSVGKILGHSGNWLESTNDVLLVPHTSGINRCWNDPVFKRRAATSIIDFLEGDRHGFQRVRIEETFSEAGV